MNVRVPISDTRDRKKAFGLALEIQNGIIDKMTATISSLRAKGKRCLLPFQKGIIISNNSLKLLYEDLKTRHDVKYILTYHLNQDVLENFFGAIRSKGGLHDHPNALEFRYRLRAYILGRNEGSLSAAGNTETDDTPDLRTSLSSTLPETLLSGQCFSQLISPEPEDETEVINNDPIILELDAISYDGLENLAGFISHKLKNIEPTASTSSEQHFTWVDHLSEGGLSKPSEQMMHIMQQLESIFQSVNAESIFICQGYLDNLLKKAANVNCSINVKMLFFRSRMYFRIKKLNKILQDNTTSKKRKISKTTS